MSHLHEVHVHEGHVHQGHVHQGHVHPHAPAENYSARPHPEFVVLDIGEDVGALIVHTDGDMHGMEVEISPAGDDARRSHKDVLERSINGRPAFTAVFDGLKAGAYTLWTGGDARTRDVIIEGGEIAELDWSARG
jgi:hypothetical protein